MGHQCIKLFFYNAFKRGFKFMEKQKQGFAIVALVLGIIGMVFSFIPIINNLAFFIGIIAVVFGIVALITKNKKGLSIAGIITGILAIVITFVIQAAFSSAINSAIDEVNEAGEELESTMDDISGDNTEELLGTAVDVQLGTFTATQDEYGFITSSLPVTVTNLSDESASFSITIEAINADGSRLETGYVYCDSLGASQSMSDEVFTYITSDQLEAYQSATFQVLEVSKY